MAIGIATWTAAVALVGTAAAKGPLTLIVGEFTGVLSCDDVLGVANAATNKGHSDARNTALDGANT